MASLSNVVRVALPAVALLVACGSDPDPLCTPGASVACVGAGGCMGGQVCNAAGSGFGACECATPPDAGPMDGGPADMSFDGNLVDMLALDEGVVDDAAIDGDTIDGGRLCPDSSCPAPAAGLLTICGYAFDLETSRRIEDGALVVRVYDALDFAGGGTTSLGEATPDECGFYRVVDVVRPSLGYVALVADDAASSDARVATAVFFPAPTSGAVQVDAFSLARTTDAAWSASLTGPTLGERGARVLIFTDPSSPPPTPPGESESPLTGAPVAGVQVRISGAAGTSALVFSDVLAHERSMVVTGLLGTGPNGTSVPLTAAGLVEHTGSGGEPAGCTWEAELVGGPAGLVVVAEISAVCP